MNVGWLIDGEMFEHYPRRLGRRHSRPGHDVRLIRAPQPPYRWDDAGCSYRETFSKDSCVIAHGDIELVSRIYRRSSVGRRAHSQRSRIFTAPANYCRFGEFLLT